MTKWTTNGLFPSFLSSGILLLSLVPFISPKILAEGTDTSSTLIWGTTRSVETTSSKKEKHTRDVEAAVAEELVTEAIWFGFGEEVAIATRHESPIGKAPSIVTVITVRDIKNLGYRTFVEILRTVPGFEILKDDSFGAVVPNVRGLIGSEKIRVMLNGHLVNNPFSGGGIYFI